MYYRDHEDLIKISGFMLFTLLFVASQVFGAGNALIDNQKFQTLTVLDSFYFSFEFSPGDTCAAVEVWADLNEDAQIDTMNDVPLYISKEEGEFFCDGDEEDSDGPNNGTYQIMVTEFFPLAPAQFVFKVDDGGGADSAILYLLALSSPYVISGKVVEPANVPHLVVRAETKNPRPDTLTAGTKSGKFRRHFLNATNENGEYIEIMTMTDTSGAYILSLPADMPLEWDVNSRDMFMRLSPEWIPPEGQKLFVDNVLVDVNFKYLKAEAFITGRVTDENGLALMTPDNEPFNEVWVWGHEEGMGFDSQTKIKPDGTYILSVMQGNYIVGVHHDVEFYMLPHHQGNLMVNPGDSLVGIDFKLYRTNSMISGVVMEKQEGFEKPFGAEINAYGDKTGNARAWTDENGYYELYVSDVQDKYRVELMTDQIPPEMIVEGGTARDVAPGSQDVNFYLVKRELHEAPWIEWIKDVPNDQGRQVRIVWTGSDFDRKDSPWWDPITQYGIWRAVAMPDSPLEMKNREIKHVADFEEMGVAAHDGSSDYWYTIEDDSTMLWDFVRGVPAVQMPQYAAVVPTLGDSTEMGIFWSHFVISAHTADPFRNYFSQVSKGYSIDNLKPPTPVVMLELVDEGAMLSWQPPDAPDVIQYNIYRSEQSGFTPKLNKNLLGITPATSFLDKTYTLGTDYYYRVEAVDDAHNRSISEEIKVSGTGVVSSQTDAVPTEYNLSETFPNPFNAATQFIYQVPKKGLVTIRVYNVIGEEITTLVQEVQEPGTYRVIWNGRDAANIDAASGIYIYEMISGDFKQSKKMILLR